MSHSIRGKVLVRKNRRPELVDARSDDLPVCQQYSPTQNCLITDETSGVASTKPDDPQSRFRAETRERTNVRGRSAQPVTLCKISLFDTVSYQHRPGESYNGADVSARTESKSLER
ncbi:hypothetical protein HZH66_003357 [Vespula vulgaris]|uniref:Uncharacterized protein n=1 Tax=Vespula vulgaris TaxID=7454 RepID=A0A834KLG8_VESVU|nr:hypothetical protein HZH66_003357 [Vespula vulgaris]